MHRLTTIGLLLLASCASAQNADHAFLNGNIATMDASNPRAEAVAVADGKIIAVGSRADVQKHIGGQTLITDLEGKFTIPGFIESHGHFSSLGFAKMQLELRNETSWDAIVAKVAEAAKETPKGEWIIGGGWHQEKWTQPLAEHVEGYPLHAKLSAASPDNPVLLSHASGHMSMVNAQALRLAGINDDSKNPSGGEILRDEDGHATGVLRETAEELVVKARQRASMNRLQTWRRAIDRATEECLVNGVTSFHDAGTDFEEIDRYRQVGNSGGLKVRLWIMVRDSLPKMQQRISEYRLIGEADGFLTVRAIKQSLDGALGSHGAWLREPYEDLVSSTGLNTLPLRDLEQVAELAAKQDFQLCVHAIGDRANHEVLNLYEKTFKSYPTQNSRRWRIEHAQHLLPGDIPRFGKLKVVAAMQGVHCTSDAVFVGMRLGQRRAAKGAYMWRSLLDSGAIICNGTDAPVEDVNPIDSFYASVTRKTRDGIAFYPEQCMTREEALRSYTLHAAYAASEDDIKGSLTVGKVADMTVLSSDLLECDESKIQETQIEMTVIGGRILYQR